MQAGMGRVRLKFWQNFPPSCRPILTLRSFPSASMMLSTYVPPEASRANVREIGRRLRERGIEVVILPTGGKFQGALAARPELHIEPGFGPRPGTTEWHLKPEGYAILARRDLPRIMEAVACSQATRAR
jgi:hypothetical protein